MNGESAFGWFKLGAALLVLAVLGFVAYEAWETIKAALAKIGQFGSDAAGAVGNAATAVAKAPSQVTDTIATAATGREESLGGWLADLLDPNTRAVNLLYSRPSNPSAPVEGP